MKIDFSIFKEPMKNIMSNIYVLVKNSPIEEYKNIKVKYNNNILQLYAYSEFKAIRYEIPIDLDNKFSFIVDMKKFDNIVKTVGESDLRITDSNIIIKYKNKKIKISRFIDSGLSDDAIIPEIKRDMFNVIDYDKINFKEGIDVVKNFVAKDKYENVLSNIYFFVDDKLKCVGLDRATLCLYSYDDNALLPDNGAIIADFNFEDTKYLFSVCFLDDRPSYNLFTRETKNFKEEIYTRVMAEEYIDFMKAIRLDGNKETLKINKKELLDFITTTYKILGNGVTFFAMTIGDEIVLKAYDTIDPNNKYEQTINDFENNFKYCNLGFNIKYVLNILNNIDGDYFVLNRFNGDEVYYNIQDNILQLIMPVVLDYI